MIAKDRGRGLAWLVFTPALLSVLAPWALSQQVRSPRPVTLSGNEPPAVAAADDPARTGHFVLKTAPVNPNDPIAIINNEVVTRQQLADECVAREGSKILEAMIARRMIEQAMRARKIEVTPTEIDEEIETIAQRIAGVGREAWLRSLDKERGISPAQYARDIIYPSLALRKLATPRVQVTPADIKDAFEANYGERLHCRMIIVEKQRTAIEIWEMLKTNPDSFATLAKERSVDKSTSALGGLLPEPLARHAYPRNISDAAYQQLVDGDPKDKDPAHKPKDGDVSGPIQVNESAFILVKREKLEPARSQDSDNPRIRATLSAQMFEVKLKEAMTEVFNEMLRNSSIDNRLTGTTKLANEERHPDSQVDANVKMMGGQAQAPGKGSVQGPAPGSLPVRQMPSTPVGVSADAARAADSIRKPLINRPPSATATSSPSPTTPSPR